MKRMIFGLLAILFVAVAPTESLAQTNCVRNEQSGCLTFQVGTYAGGQQLVHQLGIPNMSRRQQAENLGMGMYRGWKKGAYKGTSSCVRYLFWMKPSWFQTNPERKLPTSRMSAFKRTASGQLTAGPARHSTDTRGLPTSQRHGFVHYVVEVSSSGPHVGLGVPKDVVRQIALLIQCPCAGARMAYPDTVRESNAIVHTGQEIGWYLNQRWDFVMSAMVAQ